MGNRDEGWLTTRRTPLCVRRPPPSPSKGDGDHAMASAIIRAGGRDVQDDAGDAAMTTTTTTTSSSSPSSSSPPATRGGVAIAIPPSLMPYLGWTRMASSHPSNADDGRRKRARRMRERRDGDDLGKLVKVTGRAVVSFFEFRSMSRKSDSPYLHGIFLFSLSRFSRVCWLVIGHVAPSPAPPPDRPTAFLSHIHNISPHSSSSMIRPAMTSTATRYGSRVDSSHCRRGRRRPRRGSRGDCSPCRGQSSTSASDAARGDIASST